MNRFTVVKNYGTDLAEFAHGELYTDQYKVKFNDLVSRSTTLCMTLTAFHCYCTEYKV